MGNEGYIQRYIANLTKKIWNNKDRNNKEWNNKFD